ncbi:MAG TPA: Gfo/Idh/MocA family oxidoreductase [Chloroflexota bacterium]|nr:Gfo/Idh/MocA family oxidoreductase [Chloroflexota bacterium]
MLGKRAKRFRVAIIGTGRMAGLIEDELVGRGIPLPYGHFPAYAAIPETEVVAVANRGQERLDRFARRFGVSNTYLDYREMIEQEKPDIVSVTTPSFARAEPIIFAAEHGVRGIYAEKGLCASLEEADRIAEAVRRNTVAFNWGAMRRHNSGYTQLRDAIARGEIGEPRQVAMYFYTDLIKHHPHTLDLVSMLLGDPKPEWVEGRLVEPGDPLAEEMKRPLPTYDATARRFVPPPGREIADPMVGFYRVGYAGGAEASFVPYGRFDVDVVGTKGRAFAWNNGARFGLWRGAEADELAVERTFEPVGDTATVNTIRDIIREMETGERTAGNIDVTMCSVEVQFGLAQSHIEGASAYRCR